MSHAQRWSGFAVAGLVAVVIATAFGGRTTPAHSAVPRANLSVPPAFVENRGQAVARVRYYAQGNRYSIAIGRDQVMLSLLKRQHRGVALALRFLGKNPAAAPVGAVKAAGTVNYLTGTDRARWRTQVPRYDTVVYRNLWPGVDLSLRQQAGVLKYEFRVRPGARPSAIRLAYAGARNLRLGAAGALQIHTALGVLRDSAPVSYQRIGGRRVSVPSRYALNGAGRFGFAVGAYRHDRDLIVDPGIQFTTFLGGASHEIGGGIAVDAAGDSYVTGTTQSPDFPTTAGAFDRTGAPSNFPDAFVSKLNPAGTALVYSTFVGGSDFEFGRRIAIDAAGNAYVTGQTKSSNFPTTGGAFSRALHIPPNCPRCATDNTDGFAFKLNAAGSALLYSTYLGGTEYDDPRGIAVDGSGNAYITGETLSADFPTTAGAFNRTYRGNYDMFVTKVNTGGTGLAYSTFLGGTQVDNGERISVDSAGNAYALGFTSSTDFPTTAGAFDTSANGGFDASLTKLNPAGSALVYSTYLGGDGSDDGSALAVDSGGNAYVGGGTSSANFPTTPGAFDSTRNAGDAYVTKLNPAGSGLVYSTLFGGSSSEGVSGLTVDPAGNAWLTGGTASTDFPVSADAADSTQNGMADAFITELNSTGSALPYSTFLGGSQSEGGNDIARDPTGDVYVTGLTYSMDFPATVGAFDRVFNGDLSIFWGDAFVTKLDLQATTSTPVAPQPVPVAPTLLSPTNASSQPQPITVDWSDVAGAATYEIQIDDSSSFAAPLVRDQTVSTSMYGTSGLAGTTHFWRARGINLNGIAGPWSAVRSFTAQAAPPAAELGSLDTNPSSVVGGNASSGTVVLSAGAPFGGALISLSSSNPAVASVPATVLAAENSFVGLFTIATSPVSTNTTVTITATYNGSTRTASLTVTPAVPDPPAATLQSLSVSPGSVAGGSAASGTVVLSGPAPAAGATVTLSSGDPAASVPASVTVFPGATSATFTVATSTVGALTTAIVSAVYNGATRTAPLTVTGTAPSTAALTVTATGRSGERISSSPAGINVAAGSSGSASFTVGTSITLSVTNGRSAIWSGACSSGGSKTKTCTFTLSGTASVTGNVQ